MPSALPWGLRGDPASRVAASVCDKMPFNPLHTGPVYGQDIASAVSLSLENGYDGNYDCFDPWYEAQGWKNKNVKSWTEADIVHWISGVAREFQKCPTEFPAEKFVNMDGYQLMNLTLADFLERDRTFGGILYDKLQELIAREYGYHRVKVEEQERPILTSLDETDDSTSGMESEEPPPPPEKKGRGRPRLPRKKKKTEKLGRLWEFLRDLLKNPDYCPSLIVWENYEEGMFRFVHSDRVAKLWGSKKENPDMNYEKLSRAMRYYYKSKVLMPVYGRRLVYKFGPNATNWRVDNPNFAN